MFFGARAFEADGARFTHFLQSGLPAAAALRTHWERMQARLGGRPDAGPLSCVAAQAGAARHDPAPEDEDGGRSPRLQAALARQLEQHAARELDAALRQLPPVAGPTGALIPDPRLASWAEMCDVGRGFLTAAPSDSFAPTGREYQEMVAWFLGAASPLASELGVGRAVRSSYRRHRLTLDRWGIALTVAGELQGSSRDAWRVHHDACAARMFDDALRAGIVGRTEVHTLFSDLLPPPLPGARRGRRAGLVPDALLARRATGEDEGRGVCDHLHDVKVVHYCPTRYTQARVLDRSVGCCADRRAEGVHGEYEAHARDLDARHHADVADPERRPILTRLSTYPRVRGLVIGAFAETSADVRLLLRETAEAAAARFWRDAGATSATAAQSVYMSVYRRRWGAEFALQGARMRIARAYLVTGQAEPAPRDPRGGGFDPGDAAAFAAASAPSLPGVPQGQSGFASRGG